MVRTVHATLNTPRISTFIRIFEVFPDLVLRIDEHGITLLGLEQYPVYDTIYCGRCKRMLQPCCFPASRAGCSESVCLECDWIPPESERLATPTAASQRRVPPATRSEDAAPAVVASQALPIPEIDKIKQEPNRQHSYPNILVARIDDLYNDLYKRFRLLISALYRRIKWLWLRVCGPKSS